MESNSKIRLVASNQDQRIGGHKSSSSGRRKQSCPIRTPLESSSDIVGLEQQNVHDTSVGDYMNQPSGFSLLADERSKVSLLFTF